MYPFLNLGSIKIPLYGLSIVLGIIIASFIGFKFTVLKKRNPYDLIIISAVIIAFGFAGAKILYVLIAFSSFKEIFLNLFKPGGFVFYGGLIGGIIGYLIGTKIAQVKIVDFIDVYAIIIPLVHAFGRIGCFFSGCCYGCPYDGPLSVTFTNQFSFALKSVPLLPIQLIESSILILISLIVFLYDRVNIFSNKRNINSFFLYLILYSITRFILEFFRYDFERGFLFYFSTSQIISILIFIITTILFFFFSLKKNRLR